VSARVSIDTGVFIDYIDIKSPFHKLAQALIDSLTRMEVFLPRVILAETCYVAARIYKTLGFSNFLKK
jgi:predicted nucleic acid-binding protein